MAVVGGLILSQALTLYIMPVLYAYLDRAGMPLVRALERKAPRPAE